LRGTEFVAIQVLEIEALVEVTVLPVDGSGRSVRWYWLTVFIREVLLIQYDKDRNI
jgi:hypothetical protein